MRTIFHTIYAELLKFKRAIWFYILSLIYILILFLLFFQRALNPYSGYYYPEISSFGTMISFNMLFLTLFGVLWGVSTGAFIGGSEFKFDTMCVTIGQNGRFKTVLYKFIANIFFSFIAVITSVLIGFILPLLFSIKETQVLNMPGYIFQFATAFFTMILYTIIGFSLAFLFRSQKIGIIMGILVYFLPSYFNGFIQGIKYLSVSPYVTLIAANAFKNMEYDPQITMFPSKSISPVMGFIILFSIIVIFMVIIVSLSLKREYPN